MTKPNLRNLRPSWPAVLLFTALLAQAPHAAAVFIRIAPHDAQWEIVTSFIGAWVYAIALEGATAYFVWRNQLRWAVAFAVFSIAHNVAYYLPAAWVINVYGAQLTVRYVFSAVLISLSLPIAIAAFSHVQAKNRQNAQDTTQPSTSPVSTVTTPVARPMAPQGQSSVVVIAPDTAAVTSLPPEGAERPTSTATRGAQDSAAVDNAAARARALQLAKGGKYTTAEIARMVDKPYNTVQSWLRRAQPAQNGSAHHA